MCVELIFLSWDRISHNGQFSKTEYHSLTVYSKPIGIMRVPIKNIYILDELDEASFVDPVT
jgi:hypothetical protein